MDGAQDATPLVARRDDAAATQPLAADLELGLDQRDDVAAVGNQGPNRRERNGKRDEAEVAHDQVESPAEGAGVDVPDVGARQVDDPGVVSQPRRQLTVADVECGHLAGSVLEQDLREASGTRADVEAASARDVDRPQLQGMQQLERRSTDPAVDLAGQRDDGGIRDLVAGLAHDPLVDENDPVADELTGLAPRSGEAASHECSVEAAAGHAPPRSLRRDWRAARARSPSSIRWASGAS